MAVNEMVTDVVAESAYKQISLLRADMQAATKDMVEFSKAGKAAYDVFGGTKNLVDFTNAAKASSEANKGAIDRLEDYKKAVKETDSFMNQFSNTMKENIKLFVAQQSQMDQIKKELKEAKTIYGENSAQVHKLTDEQLKLKAAMSETRIALTAENKERIAAAGSIDELAQRLGRLKDTYRSLSDVERNSEGGLKLVEQIQAMDAELKKANASIGNFQGNVGNYPSVGAELKDITNKLIALKIAGKENSDEFRDLSAKAQGLQSAMGGVNRELKEAGKQSQSFMDRLKEMGKNLLAAATAYLSFQTVKQVISDSIEEISQADEAAGRLKNTLEGMGAAGAFNRLTAQAQEFADKLKYLDNDDLNEVFNKLLTYGKLTEDQMSSLLPVIIDFAAKEKVSVVDASETIIKALEGNGKALKTYGIDIKDAADATETAASPTERLSLIMKELKPRVDGAAEAFGNTLPGKIGILKQSIADLEEEFGRFLEKLSGVEEQQLQNAISAGKEAREAEKLVTEYEDLSKKVDQTTEDKERLNAITTTLVTTFGDSVVEIDKETGAIRLNIEATKDLIKQRLLLNNQEASKYALQYQAAEEKRKANAEGLTKAQILFDEAVKRTGITLESIQNKAAYTKGGNIIDNLTPTEKQIVALNDNVNQYKRELDKYLDIKIAAADKLRALGFEESNVDKLFNPGAPIVAKAGGDKSEKKPEKDNRLKIEQEFTAQSYALIQQRIKALQFEQQTIIDSDASAYQERLAAQAEFNELQKLADKKANEAQLQEIQNSLDEIERIKKISADKRTPEQKELLARENIFLLKQVEANENYEAARKDSAKRASESILAIQKSEADKRFALISDLNDSFDQQELVAQLQLKGQYDKGLINFETYTKAKKRLEDQFQFSRLAAQRAFLEAELSATKLIDPGADVSKYVDAISKIDLSIGKLKLTAKEADPVLKGLIDQAINQAWTTAADLMNGYYEAEIAHQQSILDNIETNRQAQIDAINASGKSEKQKQQDIRALNAQVNQEVKQHQREIADLKRKEAIADRTAAILRITEETAVAAMHQAASGDPYTAIFRTAAVISIGLAQIASVLARPLPAYGDGTKNHPGGGAVLGDKYERELVEEPGKAPYWSADTPTYYDLKAGTKVTPERLISEHDLLAAQMGFMTPSLMSGITVNSDYKALEETMKTEMGSVRDAINNKPVPSWIASNGEFRKIVTRGNSTTQYLNDNFYA